MTSGEADGACNAGKVEPFSVSEGFVTYKRRKRRAPGSWGSTRDESSVRARAGQQQMMKMPHQSFLCNGNSELSGQERIVSHWRSTLEQLAQSVDVKSDCMLRSCIGRALSCGLLGYSDSTNFNGVQKDHQKSRYKLRRCSSSTYGVFRHNEVSSNGLQISANSQPATITNNSKYQSVLFDLLVSHKFASLCNLLCENFKCGKVIDIGDFSVNMSKMKNGASKESIECVMEDIQAGLEKLQKIGEEMTLLASDLSSASQVSYKKQARGCSSQASGEPVFEGVHPTIDKKKISVDLYAKLQPIANDPNSLTNPEQRGASRFDIMSTCKQCGSDIHEKNHIVCSVCGAVYHVPCIQHAVEEIETRSWYCTNCAKERGSVEHDTSNEQHDHMLQNGMVWHQHDDSWYQECRRKNPEAALAVVNGTRELPTQVMENTKTPEPLKDCSVTRLCKQCGGPEVEDKLFLVCSHSECLYKYYHIRCLKGSQVASQHQQPNNWYCPSCLCRGCFTDRDDELICICDSCDEAYHTYCMNPPRAEIPDGIWYCYNCERDGKGTSGREV